MVAGKGPVPCQYRGEFSQHPDHKGGTEHSEYSEYTEHSKYSEEPACGEKDRQGDTHGGDDAVAPGSDGGYFDDEVRC